MMNPKGKWAHAVRIVWFAAIFILPSLVLTQDQAEGCAGFASGTPGYWDNTCMAFSSNYCGAGAVCIVERCWCTTGYDQFCSYCIGTPRCSRVLSGCWNSPC